MKVEHALAATMAVGLLAGMGIGFWYGYALWRDRYNAAQRHLRDLDGENQILSEELVRCIGKSQ